ncbi:hypothetical protein SEEM1594_23190 [Salmonella enterica subsp. enterica serovar Muenchen str. baa1594]|nr:hypothetical protein SEEM1594_23190 [Salmonella enterica subsp. enterica serovar Muenchen str. baa1594]
MIHSLRFQEKMQKEAWAGADAPASTFAFTVRIEGMTPPALSVG